MFFFAKDHFARFKSTVRPVLSVVAALALAIALLYLYQTDPASNAAGEFPGIAVRVAFASVGLFVYLMMLPLVLRILGFGTGGTIVTNGARNELGIMLIGDGFVGKSQVIRSMNGVNEAIDAAHRTEMYRKVLGPIFGRRRIVFYDYRGQDFQYVQKMIDKYDLSNGQINVVIFMVDLFGPPPRIKMTDREYNRAANLERSKSYDEIDDARCKHHESRINTGTIDMIIGRLVTSGESEIGLKSIILFINKVDKWKSWSKGVNDEVALQKFDDLLAVIDSRRPASVRLDRVVGSALTGDGVHGSDSIMDIVFSENPR